MQKPHAATTQGEAVALFAFTGEINILEFTQCMTGAQQLITTKLYWHYVYEAHMNPARDEG